MSEDVSRFRIRPECVDDFLALLRDAGVEPSRVYGRDDGAVAVEISDATEQQGREISAAFRIEWSTGVGFAGGNPLEMKR